MVQLKVADLFQLPPLRNARLICGHESIENRITGVNVIEAPDVADWVQEGDVLLTNLYSVDKLSPLDVFVEKVAQRGLSALIIKTGLFVQEVPEEMVAAARKHKLPIIEISKNVLYRDIASGITRQLMDRRISVLERFKEINNYFVNISLENQGFYRIVNSLEAFIGNPVALYDKNFQSLFSGTSTFATFTTSEKIKEETPYFVRQVSFPDYDSKNYTQFVFPITINDGMKFYLAINVVHKDIEEVHFIAIESAINALALDFLKQHAVIEVEKQFRSDLIGDLLSGRQLSIDDTHRRASLLQWDLRKKYAVIVFHLLATKDGAHISDDKARYDRLYELVRLFTPNLPFQVESDRVILLWDGVSGGEKAWEKLLKQKLSRLHKSWHDVDDGSHFRAGVGEVAATLTEFSRSYREALDALEIFRALNFAGHTIFFSALGVFRMLYQLCDRSRLHEYVPASLNRIVADKSSLRGELMRTLDAFLKCNQNLNETARLLGVHYKTVVYRIEKIARIADIDFKNPEEMLMIRVGLKIMTMSNLLPDGHARFIGYGQMPGTIGLDRELEADISA